MFRVLDIFHIANYTCVSIEGDMQQLKNGIMLSDEKGNIFQVESVAMSEYHNIEDIHRRGEVVLRGNTEEIGVSLYVYK